MGSIKRKVLEQIDEIIERKQKIHDVEVRALKISRHNRLKEVFTEAWAKLKSLPEVAAEARRNYERKKSEAEQRHVNSIIANFIAPAVVEEPKEPNV